MGKKRNNNNVARNKAKPKPRRGSNQPRYRRMGFLDGPALEYAKLLMDPCNGKIVPPVFPGGDAGFLFRAESFGSLGLGGTDTAGILHWSPGYVNNNSTELIAVATASGATAGTMATFASSPGRSFLITNAKGVRCIAACLKVTFLGSEAARAGRVHYGVTQASLIDVGVSNVPDQIAQTLQNYTRTPPEAIELFWRPTIADTEFNDPGETASAVIRDRKSALTVTFAGLPASVGLSFHFTAVYEWTPAPNIGVGHNTSGKADSRNTLDDVLDWVRSQGFKYVHQFTDNAMGVAGRFAGAAAMAGVYGMMGARARQRIAYPMG